MMTKEIDYNGGLGGNGGFPRPEANAPTIVGEQQDRIVDDPAGPGGRAPIKVVDVTPVPSANKTLVDPAIDIFRSSWLDSTSDYVERQIALHGTVGVRRNIAAELARHPNGARLIEAAQAGDAVRFARCFLDMMGEGRWRCR